MILKVSGGIVLFSLIIVSVAYDPNPLQDFCVADLSSGSKVNGYPCKPEGNVTVSDFFFAGIAQPAPIIPTNNASATLAGVDMFPGLNTLGVSLSRADFLPGGSFPPHAHPRATEIIFVLDGEVDIAFITTANKVLEYKLFAKTVKKGEVFVVPRGLFHYVKNNNLEKQASVIAAFNSQSPGFQSLPSALFAATPPVPDDVLARAFQIGPDEVDRIRSKFVPDSGA